MWCQRCGHRPNENDPATTDCLAANLDERDIGMSWTVRSTHRQYTWTGDCYTAGHYCPS